MANVTTPVRVASTGKVDVTVATAGTAVPLMASDSPLIAHRFTPDILIYNSSLNSNIYIGESDVDSTWIPIAPGGFKHLKHGTGSLLGDDAQYSFDLSKIYIDADSNGSTAIVEFLKVLKFNSL